MSHLPPVYTTLYQLTALAPDHLQALIDDGTVNAEMKGGDAKALRSGYILDEEFCKTILSLTNYLNADSRFFDGERIDRLSNEFHWKFGNGANSPQDLKDWLLPRLGDLLDKMDNRRIDSEFAGTDLTERNGRIVFKDMTRVVGPMDDDFREAMTEVGSDDNKATKAPEPGKSPSKKIVNGVADSM